ncbi:MAG: ECF transporter S component [Ruminococcus sp.]|nr:ECF transporter S component [Ruminococcus sp.]
MQNTLSIGKKGILAKAITACIAIAAAVLLPQIFHGIGVLSGTGAAVGSTLLPMHIPVLLAGFLGGPLAGIAAGVFSPMISSAISGMPAAALLPFMILELGTYGLVSGMLSKSRMNGFLALILTQIAGRMVRAAAVLGAVYLLGNEQLTGASAYAFITAGLFGILLQWAVIPMLRTRLEGLKKFYD